MGDLTVNNIINQTILNFNFKAVLNLFIYPAATTRCAMIST